LIAYRFAVDYVECESELVCGLCTEFSGVFFVLYSLQEIQHLLFVCCLYVVLCFGGLFICFKFLFLFFFCFLPTRIICSRLRVSHSYIFLSFYLFLFIFLYLFFLYLYRLFCVF
jgi:NADH:ubiquinone oxidoreductase subunit H